MVEAEYWAEEAAGSCQYNLVCWQLSIRTDEAAVTQGGGGQQGGEGGGQGDDRRVDEVRKEKRR